MKKLVTLLFVIILFSLTFTSLAQTSPDYIFGSDNGSGWNWDAGTAGASNLGGSYLWQFTATATADHYVKFGETSSNVDGSGFWVNSSGADMNYTGAGAKWTAYYQATMGGGGAIYWAINTGNYYVVKTKLKLDGNTDFAVFDNGAQAPVTISSVARTIAGTTLNVDVTLSGTKSANEKVWVRYSTDNWTSSTTAEASTNTSGNIWRAALALADGNFVSYYTYTTIQQASAPAEADADFFTINYNNNSSVNYTAQIGNFSGDYYIPQSGNAKGFDKLSTAVSNINTTGVGGNTTFYMTGDITESSNFGLGVNTNSYTVTIKPDADANRTITFTQATDNGGPSGGFVIGMTNVNDWTTLLTTDNVVVDGYATAGSTRRLTWRTTSAINYLDGPVAIAGNSNNITIKNCTVTHAGVSASGTTNILGIAIRIRNATSVNYVPDNITIDNNIITITDVAMGNGVGVLNSGTPTAFSTGIVIKNNTITARHRGVYMNYSTSYEVSGNVIQVNQTTSGYASGGIVGNAGNTGTHNLFKNQITQLSTANILGAGYGIRGIQASGGGTYNIYNNFITGFSTPATGTTEAVGIRVGVASNIYHNTIVMNNVTTTGPGTTPTSGIVTYTASCDVRNNIIITNEDDFASYCIYGAPIPTTSDYNLLYRSGTVNAKIGYNGGAMATLLDWQTSTTKDGNSKSANVTFLSSTNLHLDPAALPNYNLIGTPLSSPYNVDIDGETRSATYPYVGADENLANLLPVELTSFSSAVKGKTVHLTWKTATEVNSYGFEIERIRNEELGIRNWEKVGSVQASGNSNSPREYSYTDNNLQEGKYQYRLKMIDNDGTFEYSNVIEAEIIAPKEFLLSQNYPNPFNPVTTINYAIPMDSKVVLVVYSINGEKVAELVNEMQTAGSYNIPFSATGLASGTYLYRLQAGAFVQTKKMILLK